MPMERRTRSSGSPLAALTSAGMDAWLMKQGSETRLCTLPKLTVILNSSVASASVRLASTLHACSVYMRSLWTIMVPRPL